MKKAWAICLMALTVTVLFAGCKKKDTYEPVQSGIYVRADGSVIGADLEEFGEAYYDKAELQGFLEDEVTAYNQAETGRAFAYEEEAKEAETDKKKRKETLLPVSIQSLTVEEKKASLFLAYADCQAYLDFNAEGNEILTELSQRTVKEAVEAGVSFAGLKDAEGGAADAAKIQKKKKYEYLTLTVSDAQKEGLSLQVQGTIQYVSSNVTITGANTATVPAGESAMIIYK